VGEALQSRHAALASAVGKPSRFEAVFFGVNLVVAHAHHPWHAGGKRLHLVEVALPYPRKATGVGDVAIEQHELVVAGEGVPQHGGNDFISAVGRGVVVGGSSRFVV